jgi:hypothetical protein
MNEPNFVIRIEDSTVPSIAEYEELRQVVMPIAIRLDVWLQVGIVVEVF